VEKMKKLSFKILFPLIAYCIAFFEIEIGGLQQTWGDEFDTYVTSYHDSKITTPDNVNIDVDLTFTPLHSLFHFIDPQLQVVGIAFQNIDPQYLASSRLFIRNCIWLI